jgi:hypothetical protein
MLSGASFCISSLLAHDTDSQPITGWHRVDGLAQNGIDILGQFEEADEIQGPMGRIDT